MVTRKIQDNEDIPRKLNVAHLGKLMSSLFWNTYSAVILCKQTYHDPLDDVLFIACFCVIQGACCDLCSSPKVLDIFLIFKQVCNEK